MQFRSEVTHGIVRSGPLCGDDAPILRKLWSCCLLAKNGNSSQYTSLDVSHQTTKNLPNVVRRLQVSTDALAHTLLYPRLQAPLIRYLEIWLMSVWSDRCWQQPFYNRIRFKRGNVKRFLIMLYASLEAVYLINENEIRWKIYEKIVQMFCKIHWNCEALDTKQWIRNVFCNSCLPSCMELHIPTPTQKESERVRAPPKTSLPLGSMLNLDSA